MRAASEDETLELDDARNTFIEGIIAESEDETLMDRYLAGADPVVARAGSSNPSHDVTTAPNVCTRSPSSRSSPRERCNRRIEARRPTPRAA